LKQARRGLPICLAAENRNLTKRQRNEKIADLVIGLLVRVGHFENNAGEISFVDRDDEEISWPLKSFLERERGGLLDQIGLDDPGNYSGYIPAVIGRLALRCSNK
jgi:hypothetical protein